MAATVFVLILAPGCHMSHVPKFKIFRLNYCQQGFHICYSVMHKDNKNPSNAIFTFLFDMLIAQLWIPFRCSFSMSGWIPF